MKERRSFNSIFMMADSCEGSTAQIRQPVGTRVDGKAWQIRRLTTANSVAFRRFSICPTTGKKGPVDTALKTANSGFLRRPLMCRRTLISLKMTAA